MSSDGSREEESGFGRRMFMERQQLKMGEPVSYRFETGSSLVASDSQRKAGTEQRGCWEKARLTVKWNTLISPAQLLLEGPSGQHYRKQESEEDRAFVKVTASQTGCEGEARSLLEESCS